MDTVYRVAAATARLLQSRLISASVLAVVSSVVIVFVSLNVTAVTLVEGDSSRVALTLDNKPQRESTSAKMFLSKGNDAPAAKDVSLLSANRLWDVQVTADGVSTIIRMSGGTVADALKKVGVTLDGDDRVNADLAQGISGDLDINIDRITIQEYTVNETEKFTSIVDYTNTIPYGKSIVKRAGVNGSKTTTYRRTIENGKLVNTEVVTQVVNQKMVQEIKLEGTVKGTPLSPAPFDIPLNAKGQPVNYKVLYSGRATAYSSDRGYAGKSTASGRKAQVGVVAVNPKIIPYGTKLYIVSPDGSYVYGYAVAGDTGTALMNGHCVVDLFFAHYEECLKFGAKTMNVYVIE